MPKWNETIKAVRIEDGDFDTNRDNFASALERSKWFKESEEYGDLWQLWDEIKDAETVEHFDYCLAEIYDLADYDRIWITFDHQEKELAS